jgi:hypothetical protein
VIVTSVALGVKYVRFIPRFAGFARKYGFEPKVRVSEDDCSTRHALRTKAQYFVHHALQAAEPILALDIDAIVWSYPALFDQARGHDFAAVPAMNGREWETSTLLAFPTERAKRTLEAWGYYMDRDDWQMDCSVFTAVVREKTHATVFDLPRTYGWVKNWHFPTLGNQTPTIEFNVPMEEECGCKR